MRPDPSLTSSSNDGSQVQPRCTSRVSGKVILLNGASSSGKSSLARALQAVLDEPFWHISIDHLLAAGVLPKDRIDSGDFSWSELRPLFFDGFHRCVPALAQAGNNLIVEHIVETEAWLLRLLDFTVELDVFYVAVHCPLPELERREQERGDRRIGEARGDFEAIHAFGEYDFEVLSTEPVARNAMAVHAAWQSRDAGGAFARMRLQFAGRQNAA